MQDLSNLFILKVATLDTDYISVTPATIYLPSGYKTLDTQELGVTSALLELPNRKKVLLCQSDKGGFYGWVAKDFPNTIWETREQLWELEPGEHIVAHQGRLAVIEGGDFGEPKLRNYGTTTYGDHEVTADGFLFKPGVAYVRNPKLHNPNWEDMELNGNFKLKLAKGMIVYRV